MKRLTTLLLLLCCLPFMAMAQDLNPGQQSQGLLESRNVTVDYSTGIFHYQIPLYTLKSGDYELPISLRYTGKRVKVSDKPGLVGYNWTLDTGGIVTRTVRGGIPDEKPLYGYLHFENDSIPLSEDATRVNRHKRDGECDIFTAVFGGKSVNFIIRKDDNGDLYAEPLERTDVKIECANSGNFINGWIVTDNDGTRYTYMRKEWTTNLNKQDQISFNGISNAQYPSSWHLTSIEPVNSEAIEFVYEGFETNLPTKESRNVTNHIDSYQTRYEYGQDIFKPVHDYEACKSAFEARIKSAEYYLHQYSQQLELKRQLAKWNSENCFYLQNSYKDEERDYIFNEWMAHPVHYEISEEVQICHRVLGMTANLATINSVTYELMELLTSLASFYQESAPSASLEFLLARSVLEEYIRGNTAEFIQEQVVSSGISFKTVSPVLKSIRSKEEVLFLYNRINGQLQNVEKRTDTGSNVSSYQFICNTGSLTGLEYRDKDSMVVATTAFEYYEMQEGIKVISDVYGYAKECIDEEYAPFDTNLEEESSRILSLKKISLPDGGNICLDYELNRWWTRSFDEEYGGIRVKSLTLYNPEENRTDSISYSYEYGTLPYLAYPYNEEREQYGSFTDYIQYSRMKFRSNMTLRSGNNGLYYIETHERIAGQGTRTYLFNVTDVDISDNAFPYWMWGIPTYTIEYDEAGDIERVTQCIYHTDSREETCGTAFPECFIKGETDPYDKTMLQIMPNEKYMNLEDMAEEMGIPLNTNSNEPYIQAFRANIASRVKSSYDTFCYTLRYGGATLLAEQREYRPMGKSYTDYWELIAEQVPYSRTVYHYGNLQNHTRPTRIVSYDSHGDSTVVHNIYADDMAASASEAIARMQEANIVSPVIKKAVVHNGSLMEETVTEYGTADKEGGYFFVPVNIYSHKGSLSAYTAETNRLYGENMNDYIIRKTITYDTIGSETYLPTEITEAGLKTSIVYDRHYKRIVLQAKDKNGTEMLAMDCLHYKKETLVRIEELSLMFWMDYQNNFNPQDIYIDEYHSYRETEHFAMGARLLELLATRSRKELTVSEKEEILELIDNSEANLYPADEFLNWHLQLRIGYYEQMGMPDPWEMGIEEMAELHELIMNDLIANEGKNLREHILVNRPKYEELSFVTPNGVQTYDLFLVPTQDEVSIRYTVECNGQEQQTSFLLEELTPGVLIKTSLNLGGQNGKSKVLINGFSGLQYLAVVPEGTEFEATSYNEDSTVSLQFDPSGHMELYEYDKAGRLVLVRDENGKILKGNEYNKKSTNL